jgi:molybdopterin/thiamine biosynthesis adenylyltransferase
VGQAGADILRIAQTGVLVAVDEIGLANPWFHPAWPLCRALGALGFGGVHLSGAGAAGEDFSVMMDDFPFTYGDLLSEATPPCEIVVHLGTDPDRQETCARFARSHASAFTSVSWETSRVVMESLDEVLRGNRVLPQNSAAGGAPFEPILRIAAGVALQEALISAGQLEDAAPADPRVSFDAAAETRTQQADAPRWSDVCIEDAIIEEIGAGAVGTHLLESIVPMLGRGCELRIVDFDRVGPENLAIQPAFTREDVGRPKATVMAEKLADIANYELRIQPLVMRYEDRPPTLSPPSLRIACPDTFAARDYINRCSIEDGIPLVEAGSAPLVAQQRSYLPGRTACIAHRIPNLSDRAAAEREPQSCSLNRALTLPGTSMICGGILAAEALRALRPQEFGWPSTGTVVYDAHFPERFGVIDLRPPCSHPI